MAGSWCRSLRGLIARHRENESEVGDPGEIRKTLHATLYEHGQA